MFSQWGVRCGQMKVCFSSSARSERPVTQGDQTGQRHRLLRMNVIHPKPGIIRGMICVYKVPRVKSPFAICIHLLGICHLTFSLERQLMHHFGPNRVKWGQRGAGGGAIKSLLNWCYSIKIFILVTIFSLPTQCSPNKSTRCHWPKETSFGTYPREHIFFQVK